MWSMPSLELVWWTPQVDEVFVPPYQVTYGIRHDSRGAPIATSVPPACLRGPKHILREVAVEFGFSTGDLLSKGRSAKLVKARFKYYFRAAAETQASLVSIGAVINRDHTTVLYGLIKYCQVHNIPVPRGHQLNRKRGI